MADAPDYLGELDPDDPRGPARQIAAKLRAAILTRKLQPGTRLPTQPELANHYGVARETVKAALRQLANDRLLVSRQGSGTFVRAQLEHPVGPRPYVEAAFEATHVSIDFAGFTGETLRETLSGVVGKVREGRLAPESLGIRILLTDTSKPLALPCRADTGADDPLVRGRSDRITRRAIESIITELTELGELALVKSVNVQVRKHGLGPSFKLYILNNSEVLFGFSPVRKHDVSIEGAQVSIYDPMGEDVEFFHYSSVDGDETPSRPRYVAEAQSWFDSVWTTIATEFEL
jgi:DNA-binding transcriptional regulator YhcF (GntR family)